MATCRAACAARQGRRNFQVMPISTKTGSWVVAATATSSAVRQTGANTIQQNGHLPPDKRSDRSRRRGLRAAPRRCPASDHRKYCLIDLSWPVQGLDCCTAATVGRHSATARPSTCTLGLALAPAASLTHLVSKMWLRFSRLWVAHGDRRRGQGVMHFLPRYKIFALPYITGILSLR